MKGDIRKVAADMMGASGMKVPREGAVVRGPRDRDMRDSRDIRDSDINDLI